MSREIKPPNIPETHYLSLPLLRLYVQWLKDARDSQAALFRLYLKRMLIVLREQQLEVSCQDKEGFGNFGCCAEHEALYNRGSRLDDQMRRLFPPPPEIRALTLPYWRSLGFEDRNARPVVVTHTKGFPLDPSRYVRTVISAGGSAHWVSYLAQQEEHWSSYPRHEADSRVPFGPLWPRFLAYQQRLSADGPSLALAGEMLGIRMEAQAISRRVKPGKHSTWQKHPILTAAWWRGLYFWYDDAEVVP